MGLKFVTSEDLSSYAWLKEVYGNLYNKSSYNKAVQELIAKLKNVSIYEDSGEEYLQLHAEHTLWHITLPADWSDEDYYRSVNKCLKDFSKKHGVDVYALGRSGRHICIKATYENLCQYEILKHYALQEHRNFIKLTPKPPAMRVDMA